MLGISCSGSGLFDASSLLLTEFDSSIEATRIKVAPTLPDSFAAVAADADNYDCDDYDGGEEYFDW